MYHSIGLFQFLFQSMHIQTAYFGHSFFTSAWSVFLSFFQTNLFWAEAPCFSAEFYQKDDQCPPGGQPSSMPAADLHSCRQTLSSGKSAAVGTHPVTEQQRRPSGMCFCCETLIQTKVAPPSTAEKKRLSQVHLWFRILLKGIEACEAKMLKWGDHNRGTQVCEGWKPDSRIWINCSSNCCGAVLFIYHKAFSLW